MFRLFILFFIIFTVSGCDMPPPDKEISREYRQYKLLELRPPKHVYITVQDVKTGYVWNKLFVSKHCNSWRKIPNGSIWGFELVTYEKPDGSRYQELDNYKNICYRV